MDELASILRITKGTASKTIDQLGSKGLISKFQREDKVHFRLTEIGQLAFETITVITSPEARISTENSIVIPRMSRS
ncbi:hypothetical protein QUF95_09170 [Paenibacillus silvae]|uniref:hypothetical protein n=1 Tax=Paenibacillus silvae TaxID=1325358 RepID=UPI0025A2B805|nr:hypothetical protein [Paenibacillus silvae]MDM5277550.1 hypothetical protein [Paenibacillus silvae]